MSPGIVVFLLGLFAVPIVLLSWGHKVRWLSPAKRSAFWGAVTGHCAAGVLAISFGMIPPESWTPDETVRGFLGLWSLLVLPVLGGIGGALFGPHRR
jgi:hypothetical protein